MSSLSDTELHEGRRVDMSRIHATNDFTVNTWDIATQDIGFGGADLFIGFVDGSPMVRFKKLSFGYELRQGDNIKKYGVFPPAGATYVSSDQSYLVTARFTLEPNTTYTLLVWCENDGRRSEGELTFATPVDDQLNRESDT